MTELRTQTLSVPGAKLAYEIRDAEGQATAPVPLMILGGEFGWKGDPDAFAAALRKVLEEDR